MEDKTYHTIYEALFRCTLLEKEAHLSSRKGSKSAESTPSYKRLVRSAKGLKEAVIDGAPRIKRKTVRALVDHITEVLPGPDGNYYEPLLADYLKAFIALCETPSVVEGLASIDGEGWQVSVDFCIELLSRYLETGDRGGESLSRASPAPEGAHPLSLAPSTGRSSSSSSQRLPGQITSQMAVGVLSGLNSLASGTNAPVQTRASAISKVVLQLLQVRSNKISELHKLSFSTINSILAHVQTDDLALARSLTRELVPVLTHWWQPRALSRDAMLNAIRDEMLKTMFSTYLYIDSLTCKSSDTSLLQDLEDLLDGLWLDYSRRGDQMRLQLEDLSFTSMTLPDDHPRTVIFSLQPFNQLAEQNWALLENIAILEAIFARNSQKNRPEQEKSNNQPRKRQRVAGNSNRLFQKIVSPDPGVRLTGLQLVPFYVTHRATPLEEILEAVETVSASLTDKQGTVATWAMLACSR